jgi:hypothetical protein
VGPEADCTLLDISPGIPESQLDTRAAQELRLLSFRPNAGHGLRRGTLGVQGQGPVPAVASAGGGGESASRCVQRAAHLVAAAAAAAARCLLPVPPTTLAGPAGPSPAGPQICARRFAPCELPGVDAGRLLPGSLQRCAPSRCLCWQRSSPAHLQPLTPTCCP